MSKHNADVNLKDRYGWTALHLAAGWWKLDGVKVLLEHNADVNVQGKINMGGHFIWQQRSAIQILPKFFLHTIQIMMQMYMLKAR
ncbi:hypothetical protein C0995_002884 [Termitomyces sp. Mi166|nr:hypothetical protein C0995_002884 [Termitomyces sp. Mi166\